MKLIDAKYAINAGANLSSSPGSTDNSLEACEQQKLPIFLGDATSTEIMRLFDLGYSVQKFFPAEAIGGQAALKAFGGPLPNVKFCPTGGITVDSAKDFLLLPNVPVCGGTWLTPKALVANKKWADITKLAKEASNI